MIFVFAGFQPSLCNQTLSCKKWNQKEYQWASVLSHKPTCECCWNRYEILISGHIYKIQNNIHNDIKIPDSILLTIIKHPSSLKQVWSHSSVFYLINKCCYQQSPVFLHSFIISGVQCRWKIRKDDQ